MKSFQIFCNLLQFLSIFCNILRPFKIFCSLFGLCQSFEIFFKFCSPLKSLEVFCFALPAQPFKNGFSGLVCLGLSSHSWDFDKSVYARYARYTNSNALLWLCLSSIDVFCPHFVRAKKRPSGLERLSSPRQILL